MIDATAYNITIRKGTFDGENCFQAKIVELPDVAEYADTYEEAYSLAIDTIQTTAEIFAQKGKAMPQPIVANEDYSGRVTLRLPKTLHAALVKKADHEDVSLNQLLVSVLSAYRGFDTAMQATREDWVTIDNYYGITPTKTAQATKVQTRELTVVELWSNGKAA